MIVVAGLHEGKAAVQATRREVRVFGSDDPETARYGQGTGGWIGRRTEGEKGCGCDGHDLLRTRLWSVADSEPIARHHCRWIKLFLAGCSKASPVASEKYHQKGLLHCKFQKQTIQSDGGFSRNCLINFLTIPAFGALGFALR